MPAAHSGPDDVRLRFFGTVKIFSHDFLALFIQLDYAKAMTFIALDEASGAMLGFARLRVRRTAYPASSPSWYDLMSRGLGGS
jgi:hypothetical protein